MNFIWHQYLCQEITFYVKSQCRSILELIIFQMTYFSGCEAGATCGIYVGQVTSLRRGRIKSNSMSMEHHSGSHWNDINGWLFLATPSVASSRSTLKSAKHIRTHRIPSNYRFTRRKCVVFHFALLLYYTVWQISTSSQRTMILPRRLNVAVPSI